MLQLVEAAPDVLEFVTDSAQFSHDRVYTIGALARDFWYLTSADALEVVR